MEEERFIENISTGFPHFKITKNMLAHPTSEFVVSYYVMMLEAILNNKRFFELTDCQREFLNSHHQEGVALLHHAHTQNLWILLDHITRLTSMDMFLSDLLFPERSPRRSFTIMALLLDLYACCGALDEQVEAVTEQCAADREKVRLLEEEMLDLEAELRQCEEDRELYQDKIKDVKTQFEEYNNLNESNGNLVKDLHVKIDIVTKELTKAMDGEQELQDVAIKLENDIKHLQTLIVSDPNQILENHRVKMMKKEECQKKVAQLTRTNEVTSEKSKLFDKIIEWQQKGNLLLRDDKHAKMAEFKSLHQTINNLMKEIGAVSEESSVTECKIMEAENTVPKVKAEEVQVDAELAAIYSKDSNRTGKMLEYIEAQKKLFSEVNTVQEFLAIENKDAMDEVNKLTEQSEAVVTELQTMDARIKSSYNEKLKTIEASIAALEHQIG